MFKQCLSQILSVRNDLSIGPGMQERERERHNKDKDRCNCLFSSLLFCLHNYWHRSLELDEYCSIVIVPWLVSWAKTSAAEWAAVTRPSSLEVRGLVADDVATTWLDPRPWAAAELLSKPGMRCTTWTWMSSPLTVWLRCWTGPWLKSWFWKERKKIVVVVIIIRDVNFIVYTLKEGQKWPALTEWWTKCGNKCPWKKAKNFPRHLSLKVQIEWKVKYYPVFGCDQDYIFGLGWRQPVVIFWFLANFMMSCQLPPSCEAFLALYALERLIVDVFMVLNKRKWR